jgi:hypothetical protein
LEAGFHFVPEGRSIVARRLIAGSAINMIVFVLGFFLQPGAGCR